MNWVLIIVMYGLLIFGVFAIQSAARHLPGNEVMSGGEFYSYRHKIWILAGTVVYFGTALIDYRWVRWLGLPMYVAGIILMVMAMKQGDATHRLDFGIKFQPTQLAIAAGIIATATLSQDLPKIHRVLGAPFVRVCLIGLLTGVPFLMVVSLGDMGSALVWVPVAVVALLVGGVPWRYLIFLTAIAIGILPIINFIALPTVSERGTERIEMYLESLEQGRVPNDKGNNYGPYWVSTAVGKAGWKGIGWGAGEERGSVHAKRYIPWTTAHNDYIFAVIAEEQGFRGSLLLVTAYALLLIQCLFVAFYSRDLAGRLIVGGVVGLIFAHVFENIGMCVLLTPITGIPLPLVSYSGTFVLICMFLLGLVQSIWVHRGYYNREEA